MQTAAAVLVSAVVALFGVTSAVLGFIAETKKLTPDEIHVSDDGRDCVYPANAAHTLGACAILLLAVAEIIAAAAGGCCGCCCRPQGDGADASDSNCGRRRIVGVVASVLSWVAALLAVVHFGAGAAMNTPMRRQAKSAGNNEECFYLKGGIFVRAAVLSLVATTLAIISFIVLRRLPAATDAPVEGQQVVGLPQWPTQGYRGQEAQGYGGQAPDAKLAPPAQGQEHPQVYV